LKNGQGQASFDGNPRAWGTYENYPDAAGAHVNAEDDSLTVDHLVQQVFAGKPVSSYLLDGIREDSVPDSDHTTDGYRRLLTAETSLLPRQAPPR